MRLQSQIYVTPPKFELYALVTLHHNGLSYKTRIVQRWYNPDEECWLYRVHASAQLYTIDQLEPRQEPIG